MEELKDEMGNSPERLPGVKKEEPPGPRTVIELNTRTPHQHYHRQFRSLGQGKTPILKITPDGEGEYPPGETPQPSRQSSFHRPNRQSIEERPSNEADGHWTSALDKAASSSPTSTPQRHHDKAMNARFSAFRESRFSETDGDHEHELAQKRWSMLRARVLPSRHNSNGPTPGPGKVSALSTTAINTLPVTTELFAGQLPVMMLKTWIDRDEDGRRAVPVLLGNMRFRVGDSVGVGAGKETGKEMFKVECEYGDGAVKWVIYRELRDFLSLHANYKAANFGTSVGGLRSSRRVEIPEFPKMSIPYFSRSHGKDQAQMAREALQKYLVELIRAVIFRPESNRLCRFFELSALTVALAPHGGFQGKAGFLMIPGSNASRRANQPGLTPTSWIHNRSPKWLIVRDSYFVATEGPEDTEFYDVFILDQDFAIERPKRAYRHGLHLVTGKSSIKRSHKHSATDEIEVDPENPLATEIAINSGEGKGPNPHTLGDDGQESYASQHTFFIVSSQRKLKLQARNARHMHQFIVSMERIAAQCIWTSRNRFDSFAPLRVNVAAQWLVDGRDYFWNLSRAMNMAKDRIYIHDWWLSPELYLRRPGDERYRLDNLLKRKAEEGVKVYVIIYNEVSDKTTPVDSLYAKKTLTGLHHNIMVQRSPSHFQTGTFYWSHHEKLCVIDETIAFMGGLDLCYGRWDTSQHVLTDEDHTEPDGPNGPVWRGKDYANERVAEYANLDKPFEDMFDRTKVPRMPWHDVGLQIVGQPARDLCRHFTQRWNLLIRTKNHTRRMPFLLPPPDFTEGELGDLKLQGTCEVQICRSVGPWSMGTLTKIEHSIQNAYCKSIQLSEHFVYIENQFFITSTVVDGIQIHNGIGDALVERIIRAHKEKTTWRACIVIPLLPGYTYPLDSAEASSVRMILECQNRTIARGAGSIFSRLRKEGIDPDEYITFFSLRTWSKFKSGVLTTEQVYIHGKTMIVDDRLVLCGSANINERSQRGDRDSELVAVIRDTDMIDSKMAGKPYKVGRFSHTLRMRLMREHVGIDVDSIEEDQLMSREPIAPEDEIETWDPDHQQQDKDELTEGITTVSKRTAMERMRRTVGNAMASVTKGMSENAVDNVGRAADKIIHPIAVVKDHAFVDPRNDTPGEKSERQDFSHGGGKTKGFASSIVPTLEEKTIFDRRPSATHANGKPLFDLIEESENQQQSAGRPEEAEVPADAKQNESVLEENDPSASAHAKAKAPKIHGNPHEKELFGVPANAVDGDDAPPNDNTSRSEGTSDEKRAIGARQTLRKHLSAKTAMTPWSMPTPTPKINPNRFQDPLDETFWKDMWVAVAVHNTEIFRKVFRCIPDDLVTTWAAYKAFANHAEKHNKAPEDVAENKNEEPVKVVHDGPGTHGSGGGGSGGGAKSETRGADIPEGGGGGGGVGGGGGGKEEDGPTSRMEGGLMGKLGAKDTTSNVDPGQKVDNPSGFGEKKPDGGGDGAGGGGDAGESLGKRVPSGPQEPWAQWEREEMEELLNEVRGHLGEFDKRVHYTNAIADTPSLSPPSVIYPQRFLEVEDQIGNLLFQLAAVQK
ncbi:hypothetical protein BD324DRAFT_641172 [Kockovaella imperatae]|uniref:Phospholipase n=1 Tax=Kockovaella imperatae TaxID=4999 RepID=A0A1Y1UQF5_9TREE|nr:hypothetical protein BD324DRAFT_641172 [Kockovaella imperatae]ORX40300.1 hypothetical protein BD324DRAFT_641172 [Kockovaella imperatae]